jgi:hypothetical protein
VDRCWTSIFFWKIDFLAGSLSFASVTLDAPQPHQAAASGTRAEVSSK